MLFIPPLDGSALRRVRDPLFAVALPAVFAVMTFEQRDKFRYGQVLSVSVVIVELIIAVLLFQTVIDEFIFSVLFRTAV